MNISRTEDVVHVRLSRRNLEHLIKMLDTNVGMPTLKRRIENGTTLFVSAEENADHYSEREPGLGAEHILSKLGAAA